MMSKSFIYLLCVLVLAANATDGTEAFFISPHAMTRQREVHDALEKISTRIAVEKTTYIHGSASYTIDNVTIETDYLDSKQTIEIVSDDNVTVRGGKFEFGYTFNFTRVDGGVTASGYAVGSVVSDTWNYTKAFTVGAEGFLIWMISNKTKVQNLDIFQRFKIKRIVPFNQTDLEVLQDMLDRAISQITPGTVSNQILEKFNSIMPQTLNQTLNNYVVGREVMYSFPHPTKGSLNMTIIHHLYKFGVDPQDGFKIIYVTEIKDWPEPVCNGVTVPTEHRIWEFYGGTQNIHLICIYQEVIEYMQKKGWLDTQLNTDWDSTAFQFYAGDLFDLINNLHENFAAKELLTGSCTASPNNLSIKYGREFRANTLNMMVTYDCSLGGKAKETRLNTPILNFTADVRFLLDVKAGKTEIEFSIHDVENLRADFRPVGNYYVTNTNLAMFKINYVLENMRGSRVFGSGFPTLRHEFPSVQVSQDFVIYFDASHAASKSNVELIL